MENIINMTPHPVTILDADNNVIHVFPKGNTMIRLSVSTVEAGSVGNVKLTKTVFGEPVGLPDFREGIFYIVSQLVKNACSDRTDLLVPAEVVRDANGNILGCKSLGI
jgi:hypothetical protein